MRENSIPEVAVAVAVAAAAAAVPVRPTARDRGPGPFSPICSARAWRNGSSCRNTSPNRIADSWPQPWDSLTLRWPLFTHFSQNNSANDFVSACCRSKCGSKTGERTIYLANSSNQQLTGRVNLQADEVAPQSRKGNSGRFRRPSIGFSGTCKDRVAVNQ